MTREVPQNKFTYVGVTIENRIRIECICKTCGASKIVSAYDDTLSQWENGHRCGSGFSSRASTQLKEFTAACRMCGKPIPLEECKSDDHGGPVHEDCYVAVAVGEALANVAH